MLGPSMVLVGLPVALLCSVRAARCAPDRVPAQLALLLAVGEWLAFAILLAQAALE